MLRRLMGDEAFFGGLRDFYATWRYSKAGTDDFRVAMEKAGAQPLGRFFERWIYSAAIPTVRFASRVDGGTLHVRFDQTGEASISRSPLRSPTPTAVRKTSSSSSPRRRPNRRFP
jgi:aminopeptidase N